MNDKPNHLLASDKVGIGFVNSFRSTAPEHLVVLARTEFERVGSETLATAFGLARLVA